MDLWDPVSSDTVQQETGREPETFSYETTDGLSIALLELLKTPGVNVL